MTTNAISSSLSNVAARAIKDGQQKAADLGKAGATGKRLISDFSPGELIVDALKNNLLSTTNACGVACGNAEAYLAQAQQALEEQLSIVRNALALANQAATDPSVASTVSLSALNNQLQTLINQVQNIVNTTHDAAGNAILNGVVANYSATAAGPLALIVADNATMQAATPAAANTRITVNLAANLGLSASTIATLNGIAASVTATGGTTADYLSQALQAIPTIAVDPAQINQQVADASRAMKIGAKLQTAITNAIVQTNALVGNGAGNLAAAHNNIKTSVIANLINQAIPAGNTVTASAAPTGAAATAAASIAALFTASEIQALKNFVATAGVGDVASAADGAADGAAGVAAILQTELQAILSNIACLQNVTGIIPAASAPGTDLFGALTAGGAGVTANNVIVANIYGVGAKGTISTYITTAVTNLINSAKPQIVQYGVNPSDTLHLQINRTSTDALNINTISCTSIANAQTAVANLQLAAQFLSNTLANINNQVNQLEARKASLDDQSDVLTDQLSDIENTDLTKNASELSSVNTSIATAAALIGMQNTMESTIASSARNILNKAASGG